MTYLKIKLIAAFILLSVSIQAQNLTISSSGNDRITPKWTGERFPDGRPKVSDDLLKRMKRVPLEQAWGVLKAAGYLHQYEGNWKNIHAGEVLVGQGTHSPIHAHQT
jgi:4-hydroxy-4-methyl-2-oxoglutarate aldolase